MHNHFPYSTLIVLSLYCLFKRMRIFLGKKKKLEYKFDYLIYIILHGGA